MFFYYSNYALRAIASFILTKNRHKNVHVQNRRQINKQTNIWSDIYLSTNVIFLLYQNGIILPFPAPTPTPRCEVPAPGQGASPPSTQNKHVRGDPWRRVS